ncbi:hypothetical protein PsorP6_008377 [Peronosclerospora sorghi]|uniref:Uncharacterized protein n=1 Tax=Peronosclerospora sorghi TaxID=230839 RepID=A0ACC0W6V2_9STRA|nr:hypothetical protein PsorP6_008377 [Peronosclerospora sorghi]
MMTRLRRQKRRDTLDHDESQVYRLTTTCNVIITVHSLVNRIVIPGLGNAVFLEIRALLEKLLSKGWTPYRTLVLASFGGEQIGSVGSSHWIDRYFGLGSGNTGHGVVYLHLDDVVRRGCFCSKASATIRKNIYLTTAAVAQPQKHDFPTPTTSSSRTYLLEALITTKMTLTMTHDEDDIDMLPINAPSPATNFPRAVVIPFLPIGSQGPGVRFISS